MITGQIRWLALNGTVGLALMWMFNRSGMDSRWVVFSTHSVGYVLLAVVIVIMILVFGGVVLVWTHLIDFLKEILVRYPEVKNEISENKVLEQVLIRLVVYEFVLHIDHWEDTFSPDHVFNLSDFVSPLDLVDHGSDQRNCLVSH